MPFIFRFVFWLVGGLLAVLAIAALGIYAISEARLSQVYPIRTIMVDDAGDAALLERGRHLVEHVTVCVDCHGDDLGGGVVVDDPALGRIVAPNLTGGAGGLGASLSDADIAGILLTGVKPDGRSALVMPSEDYANLSPRDVAAIITYLRAQPAVDRQMPANELHALGRILVATGQINLNTADDVARVASVAPPTEAVTAEYGGYLAHAAGCTGCHGPTLSGGKIADAPPDWPPASNITRGGVTADWTAADFAATLRTGVDKNGHMISTIMPWARYGGMTADELNAIWLYIQSLPPAEFGAR